MKNYLNLFFVVSVVAGTVNAATISGTRSESPVNVAKSGTRQKRPTLLPTEVQSAFISAVAPTSAPTNGKLFQQITKQYTPVLLLIGLIVKQFPSLVEDFKGNVGRLALGGFINSIFLVVLGASQTVNLSKGLLPTATFTDIFLILVRSLPMQTILKTIQYFSLRVMKNGFDKVSWMPNKTINTLVSYGLTATILQCAAYNNLIMNTYAHFKVTKESGDDGEVKFAPLAFWNFLKANVIPGVEYSFVRECFATGLGLILGPHVRALMEPLIGTWEPVPAKIVSGIIAGCFCATLTQWLHNNALTAGGIYQVTGVSPSVSSVFKSTWGNLGIRMFYLNMNQRALTIATATVVLTLVNIFA